MCGAYFGKSLPSLLSLVFRSHVIDKKMSLSQTVDVELTSPGSVSRDHVDNTCGSHVEPPTSAVEAVPDGGYGWIVVLACSTVTFMMNGWSGSWGVFQTALFQTYPDYSSTTSLSFVGSLSIALAVAFGLVSVRLSRLIGARYSMLLGVLMMSFGIMLSSFTLHNLGGLYITAGVSFGLGSSLTYTMSNSLPVQWFNGRLGTANGLVKLGGGLGATILAVVSQALINIVGLPWTCRSTGLFALPSGVPAAVLVKERAPSNDAPFIDWALFKNVPFCCVFLAGAVGTFALFVPPFLLPLFANSIGLSASTGPGIVAAFNACTAIGRLGTGFECDKIGSTNMLLFTIALNAVSMLAIWPMSETIGPLVLFAALNGVASGAFFVAIPTTTGRMWGSGQASVAMGMAITGWTGGYLMGSPTAGMLIAATGAEKGDSVAPYRAAIFYAGGVALASASFVLFARLRMDTKLMKKM